MTARTLARVLELDGHQVFCVFDGLSVTEQVVSFDPHVVLLDIGLPGLDGYQVAQEAPATIRAGRLDARGRDRIRRRKGS